MFIGDVIPMMAHLRPSWVMAFDILPMTTVHEKQAILGRCVEEGLRLAFPHEPDTGGVALDGPASRPIVRGSLDL